MVRVHHPELHADCIARESTVPRATALTVGRQRHGEDGANDKRIVDDDDAIAACSAIVLPRQLAWCKRSAENGEMIVQLDPWARLRRQSHVVWHFSIKEAIPSFDTRRARATSFDAHKQRLVRLQLPAR